MASFNEAEISLDNWYDEALKSGQVTIKFHDEISLQSRILFS